VPALTAANAIIRARNVTASECGALMPEGHPYHSPRSIFDRLMGEPQEPKTSEAMALGSYFEATILRYAEQRDGFRARLNARTFEHPSMFLCATVDAFVTKPGPWVMVPERALVEVKMSGRLELWQSVPPYIEWQVRAQLACTARDVGYIYVLVAQRLLRFEVYRDAAKEAALLAAVQRFCTHNIAAGVRPDEAPVVPAMTFSFDAA